jgi:hypothetical protein
MNRIRKRLVQEGEYVAEVEITLINEEGGWSPYLSLEDAYRLDDAREALGSGDLEAAAKIGRVFKLTPVAANHP